MKYTPRTEQEIKEFLFISESFNNSSMQKAMVERAMKIEQEYAHELHTIIYSYGLACDFDSTPFILEDEDVYVLEEVKRYEEGIVLYQLIDIDEGV